MTFFFLVWGLLRDSEEAPWVTSGIGASMILASAVVVREVILRRARNKQLRLKREFDQKFSGIRSQVRSGRGKLTLEQNAAILSEIKQKSDAAKVLNKFSEGHREVFELCREYISRNEAELKTVGAGSPRFSALLKGRNAAAKFHRYHLLHWAEIEARSLTSEANDQTNIDSKVSDAKRALGAIEYALESYPSEQSLLESRELLQELIVSIKVSDQVEQAERAAFRGDLQEAVRLYRDALFYLTRDKVHTHERQQAADRINSEIDRIRLLEGRQ